jgi:hypothetical protein
MLILIRAAGLICSLVSSVSTVLGQWDTVPPPKILSNGFFEASATLSLNFTLQATSDSRTWTNLGFFTVSSETRCPMIDSDAGKFPQRFYRFVSGAAVRMTEDASMNISETRLEGVVNDPQFSNRVFDLFFNSSPYH